MQTYDLDMISGLKICWCKS